LLAPGVSTPLGVLTPGKNASINLHFPNAQRAGLSGQPYMVPGSSFNSPPVFYAPDTTIDEILGTSLFYDDKNSYRRYSMLASALNVNAAGFSRGGGFYLSGWADNSPLEVSLADGSGSSALPFEALDTTLYLVTLTPALDLRAGQASGMVLPPGLFTWTLLETSQPNDITPYGTTLTTGRLTLQYDLALPIAYRAVRSLTLHLEPLASGEPVGLNFFLWNFLDETWTNLPGVQWGNTAVPDPERFVGPGGQIRLRLEDGDPTRDTHIQAVDFTLAVDR
jgi:hypothetical protein